MNPGRRILGERRDPSVPCFGARVNTKRSEALGSRGVNGLAISALLSALGFFIFLYALHFRHQALSMGPLPLRKALERAMARRSGVAGDIGDEIPEPTEEELLSEVDHLRRRLSRWSVGLAALAALLASSGWLTLSSLPALSYILIGTAGLVAFLSASSLLIRDILVLLKREFGG
jgi:hypothetical protein